MRCWRLCYWLALALLTRAGFAMHRLHGEQQVQEPIGATAKIGMRSETTKIPLKLHYIYLSGFDAYVAETERPKAKMHRWFYDSCMEVHKHWEVMFWTEEMADSLVKEHFPEFIPIWDTYDMEVKRADAIRAFIMLHHGGMYLDLDNECYRPAEQAFKDYDVVLQGTGFEGVNNGMMASAPGHPLWHTVVETLKERHKGSDVDPWKNSPIYMTGPAVLTHTVQRYLKLTAPVSGFLGTIYYVDDSVVKIYSIGEFFVPCWGADLVCTKRFERERAAGTWDMTNIVGRHWFAGSWNKPWLIGQDGRPKDRTLMQNFSKSLGRKKRDGPKRLKVSHQLKQQASQ